MNPHPIQQEMDKFHARGVPDKDESSSSVDEAANDENGSEDHSSDSRKLAWWDILIVFLVLAGCATLLWFAATYSSRSGSSSSMVVPAAVDPWRGNLYMQDLRLRMNLPVPDSGSPQDQALHWLAHSDYYFYFRGGEPELPYLVQRYVLFVIHFAMGAWGGEQWMDLVGSYRTVCLWPGVDCGDDHNDSDDDDNRLVKYLTLRPPAGDLQGSIPSEIGLLTSLGR